MSRCNRHRLLLLSTVAICAFLLRLIYLLQTSDSPLFGFHVVDASSYEEMARPIIDHNQWLWLEPTNYTPVYPGIIAALRLSFGDNIWTLKIAQLLAGVAGSMLTMLIATRFWGRKTGVVAGLLYALYWPVVIYEGEQFSESLSLFFSLLAVWFIVKPDAKKLEAFLGGLAWAFAAMLRPNLLLAIPLLALWIAWRHRRSGRLFVRDTLLATSGFILLVLPILWRNHTLVGEWLLRRQASWSLYSGLDPAFAGRAIPPGVQFNNFMLQPHRAGAHSVTEIEHYWKEKTAALLSEQKSAVMWNLARRAAMLASATEYSKEFDLAAYRSEAEIMTLPWPGWWLVFPLACAGIFSARKGRPGSWLVLLMTLALAASIIPFKLSDRYRLAVVPFLILLAAHGTVSICSSIKRREWRAVCLPIGVFTLASIASWPDWFELRAHRIARHDYFKGTALAVKGKPDEALAAFQRSMKDFPWDADSGLSAAQILWQKGDAVAAAALIDETLRREMRFPEALDLKADIETAAGRPDEAVAVARIARNLQPTPARSLALARALRKASRTNEALEAYEEANANMTDASTRIELALYQDELGRIGAAVSTLALVAMNEAPATPFQRGRLFVLLGILQTRGGEPDRAKATWLVARNNDIGDPFTKSQIRFLLREQNEVDWRNTLPNPDAEIEFTIALRRQIDGNLTGASEAYQNTLTLPALTAAQRATDPQRWSQEALARMTK